MSAVEKFVLKEIMMEAKRPRKPKKNERMEKRGPEIQNVVAMGVLLLLDGTMAVLDVG